MKIIREQAYAKLNLNLHVKSKRNDGFHELESIVLPLDFYDELFLEKSNFNEVISNINIDNNLILKVIEFFQDKGYITEGVKVTLYKKIPLASGLGGGSADAAATIRGLIKLFDLKLTKNQIEEVANSLGSDILFCLYNKPALMFSRGDKLKLIDYPNFEDVMIISLPTKNLTSEIFKNINTFDQSNDFFEIINMYKNLNYQQYSVQLKNDLLIPALNTNKIFKKYYDKLINTSKNIKMTGSGPSLFLIDPSIEEQVSIRKIANIRVFNVKILK